jgi:hypothetical protein
MKTTNLRERHGMADRVVPSHLGGDRISCGRIRAALSVVDDAIAAHQRPKLERYGAILFAVLRPARDIDRREQVEFGELHVVTGDGFVVTIQHAESLDLASVRRRLESPAARTRSRPLQIGKVRSIRLDAQSR